jgi:RNA polymerase sigma-70 factor (ECF subfamily)
MRSFPRPAQLASTDTELVRATIAGDRTAMEALLTRSQEVAYRFSLHVCGRADDAEDVMQEAMLQAFRHVTEIREPDAFRPWLYRTVCNASLMRRRLHAGEPRHVASLDEPRLSPDGPIAADVADPGPSPERVLANARLRRRIRRALAGLPRALRVVVLLREMEGRSTREVAAVLGISEGNVRTRMYRARLLLRDLLGTRS